MPVANPYDKVVMDHIKNARNYRTLPEPSHAASGVNALCGDELNLYLRIVDTRIVDAAFQCTCCGISMASASMMTEAIRGKNIQEARALGREYRALLAAAGTVTAADSSFRAIVETIRQLPGRVRCADLPWSTLEDALETINGARS